MTLSPDRIFAIVLRQFYLMRGSFARIMPLFVWVAIDIVLWGFVTRYLSTVTVSGFDAVHTLLGAVLMWDFCTRVMQGVTMTFFEDVWSKNFLNIFATPLRVAEYIIGLVLSSIATSAVGLVVMLLLASLVFGLSYFAYGMMFMGFLLVLFMFGIAIGIAAVAMVLRLGPAAEWFIWPIPAMISPFVGVFYPLSVLPEWMRMISYLLPPSYVFEGMRALINGNPASLMSLGVGAGLSAIYILLACRVFVIVYRKALQTGLIARYSAESLS